jgi:hypothetical protein
MDGTEDTDGKRLTPTLVYVDGQTSKNLFYGQKHGAVKQIPEEANRAFFQYDSTIKYTEVLS